MKKLLWLIPALIVLSGCASPTPAVEAPAPGPTAAASTPTPTPTPTPETPIEKEEPPLETRLLYQGHGSVRIVTDGKVIYIDPYAGDGYHLPADLILVTHGHHDHTALELIETRNEDCQVITWKEALVKGEYKTFDLGYVTVEAVQAGNNPGHDINSCVGYVLTFPDGKTVYLSGDTSATDQMAELGGRELDYAFFCCDGVYNMDLEEAVACAKLVGAKASIPYHMIPGKDFDRDRAERFDVPGRLILRNGEEITL